jgi:transcriptional regulator with XRE-family HTH domain
MASSNPLEKKPMESLGDFVRRVRRENRLSTTDVEKRSGGRISDAYVTRIENGQVKNVSGEKLAALAKGLGITEPMLFSLVCGQLFHRPGAFEFDDAEIFDWEIRDAFKAYSELSDEDKRDLLPTVRLLGNEIQRRRPIAPAKTQEVEDVDANLRDETPTQKARRENATRAVKGQKTKKTKRA